MFFFRFEPEMRFIVNRTTKKILPPQILFSNKFLILNFSMEKYKNKTVPTYH